MEGMNACTLCGHTTTDLTEFATHIEQHEKSALASITTCWSGENTPSTSPRGSTDSGVSSTGAPEPLSPEDTEKREAATSPSPNSITPTSTNMFVATNPFASMVAAAMAAVSGAEKLPQMVPQPETGSISPPQQLPEQPVVVPEERETRRSGKAEKVMHSCPHCNFTTYMSQHMKSHLEAHERHQGAMYQCDICHMEFSQKANMHRHRMRHNGTKPYACRFCQKRFFRKDQMQEHSMTHIKTGDNFDCPVADCTLRFSQHRVLASHLEELHEISPSQQASCKRCSLLFSNPRRLLLHYQTKHDENDTSRRAPIKEEPVNNTFAGLNNMDLNVAMQILAGNVPTSVASKTNIVLPKKRRNVKAANTPLLATTPNSMSASPPLSHMTFASAFNAYNDANTPLDMSTTSPPAARTSPVDAIMKSPKQDNETDTEDAVIDICGTDTDSESKPEVKASVSPKLPKSELVDYEKVISNGYSKMNVAERDFFFPFMNGTNLTSFFLQPKQDPVTWNPENQLTTNLSLPSSTVCSTDELNASTYSPSAESHTSSGSVDKEPLECNHCGIVFNDRTLHLLHKGLHSAQDPWKCNLCGAMCYDKYVFTSHMISSDHA
uniref:Protein krueppel n=1 Tax=Panagrellus redivivus TaxID=6233 RepID=A0A7E4ZWP8_PANRE